MYDQGGAADVVSLGAQRKPKRDDIHLSQALCIALQGGQVTRVMGPLTTQAVGVAMWIEVPPGAQGIWGGAVTFFMHMKTMQRTRLEAAHLPLDVYPVCHRRECEFSRRVRAAGRLEGDAYVVCALRKVAAPSQYGQGCTG